MVNDSMNPLTYISDNARKAIYLTYATVGIILGAIFAGFGSLDLLPPDWMLVAQAVYGYFGTATTIIAVSNVTHSGSTKTIKPEDYFEVEVVE